MLSTPADYPVLIDFITASTSPRRMTRLSTSYVGGTFKPLDPLQLYDYTGLHKVDSGRERSHDKCSTNDLQQNLADVIMAHTMKRITALSLICHSSKVMLKIFLNRLDSQAELY